MPNVIRRPVSVSSSYRIIECIGRGNFGDVYKAVDFKNERMVAIKAVNLDQSNDEISVLLQEIQLLRSMKHPNITNWFTTFLYDVTMFIVMELCGGGSCADLTRNTQNGLDEPTSVYIIREVLKGLEYLHLLKIVHRDIKAANVLLTNEGHVKLADFGVSGELSSGHGKSTFVGTPYWMAPEIVVDKNTLKNDFFSFKKRLLQAQMSPTTSWLARYWHKKRYEIEYNTRIRWIFPTNYCQIPSDSILSGEKFDDIDYDEKVDIWSSGITFIELVTGSVPNSDKEPIKALYRIPNEEPPMLPNKCSAYLREFCMACLVKDPRYRPSASELLLNFKIFTKIKFKENCLLDHLNKELPVRKRRPQFSLNSVPQTGPLTTWSLTTLNSKSGESSVNADVNLDSEIFYQEKENNCLGGSSSPTNCKLYAENTHLKIMKPGIYQPSFNKKPVCKLDENYQTMGIISLLPFTSRATIGTSFLNEYSSTTSNQSESELESNSESEDETQSQFTMFNENISSLNHGLSLSATGKIKGMFEELLLKYSSDSLSQQKVVNLKDRLLSFKDYNRCAFQLAIEKFKHV